MKTWRSLLAALLAVSLAWPAAATERIADVETPLLPAVSPAVTEPGLSLSEAPVLPQIQPELAAAQQPSAIAGAGVPEAATSAAPAPSAVSATAPPQAGALSVAAPSAAAGSAESRSQAVPSVLAAARRGDARELASLSSRAGDWFDGLPARERAGLIEDLETVAKQAPRNVPARHLLQSLVVRDELANVEPKLRGRALTPERREAVLSKTTVRDIKWYHHFTNDIQPVPEGVATKDLTITVNVKGNWRKMASFSSHLRTIFSHEYTHRLQYEGEYKDNFGAEAAAVATEMLRGVELVGLEAMSKEILPCLGVSHMQAFNSGRQWVRSGTPEGETGWYWRGFLAGAAFEVAERTGSWSDAWRFLRRVESGEKPAAVVRALTTPS